jgi:hypothetical protein
MHREAIQRKHRKEKRLANWSAFGRSKGVIEKNWSAFGRSKGVIENHRVLRQDGGQGVEDPLRGVGQRPTKRITKRAWSLQTEKRISR